MSEWYFMTGGEQQGPVTAAQLKALAANGTIGPEDLVWNQSMTEWVAARRVRGLPFATQGATPAAKPAPTKAVVAQQPAAAARRAPVQTAPAPAPEPEPEAEAAASHRDVFEPAEPAEQVAAEPERKIESARTADEAPPSEAGELLGQARAWVALMSFLFFVAIALAIAYELWRIMPEVKHTTSKALASTAQTKWGMKQIVRSVSAILMLIPLFSMLRLSGKLGKARSGDAEDVDNALRQNKSFWKTMSVTSILVIIICVSAYLYKSVLQK